MNTTRAGPRPPDARSEDQSPLDLVRRSLETLRFGAIQMTVHDGKVVQVDVTEKRRFVV